MPEGLIVYNDSNVVQVSNELAIMAIVSRGTSTTIAYSNTGTFGDHGSYRDITVTGIDPQLAILSTSYSTVLPRTQSGGSFTFRVIFAAPGGTSFTYFVMDDRPSTIGNVGLLVRNAAGVLIYSSNDLPTRPVAVTGYGIAFQFGAPLGEVYNVQTFNYGSGRQYAVVSGFPPYARAVTQGSDTPPPVQSFEHVHYGVTRSTATGIQAAQFTWRYDTHNTDTFGLEEGLLMTNVLVLDVTNY